jgi:TetR/AcrR family transcriptional regulator, regulator of mycofactocin system
LVGEKTPLSEQPLAARLRTRRSQMMVDTVEDVALRLFEQRGFEDVTVDDIAAEAQISSRTFYRYFPAKDDVLQVAIERRSQALRETLTARPPDEAPLHALSQALKSVLSAEDPAEVRRWISVIQATPSVLRAVVGGIQLKSQPVIAEFFGSRLGLAGDALVPTMLAAAAGGVIQAAHTQWFFFGGDLATNVSDGLEVVESVLGGDLATWSQEAGSAGA